MAFSFDGFNDCVTNAFPGLTNVTDSFTIEFWAWPAATRFVTPEATTGVTGDNNQRYAVFPFEGVSGGGVVGWGVSVGANGVSVFEHAGFHMPSLLVFDAQLVGWTHIAVVCSNRQPSLYLNGLLVRTGLTSINRPCPSVSLGGRRSDPSNQSHYAGLLDELAIYDRVLSSAEILAIYNAGSAGKCPMPIEPSITSQPTNLTVYASGVAMFSASAKGSPPLSYQWQHEGTNLPGANMSSWIFGNVQFDQAGAYSVIVSNSTGSTTSSNAVLTVLPAPPCSLAPTGLISWWRGEGMASDQLGGNDGVLEGDTSFDFAEVQRGFVLDGRGDGVRVGTQANLHLQDFTIEAWIRRGSTARVSYGTDGGGFIFGYGNGGYAFYLGGNAHLFLVKFGGGSVASAQSIDNQSFHHVAVSKSVNVVKFYIDGLLDSTALLGETFTFQTAAAIGVQPDNLDNGFLGTIDEVAVYSRELTATEIQALYMAGVSGKCLTGAPPTITIQPTNRIALPGSSVTFVASVTGASPRQYQWRRDGNELAGSTNSSLTLTNVQAFNAGTYTLAVSNAYGWAISSNAVLMVDTNCFSAPSGLVAWWPGDGNGLERLTGTFATLHGGLTFSGGLVEQAFDFNGSDAYVIAPASLSLDVGKQDGLTVECWLNPTDVGSSRAVWEWNNGDGDIGVHLWLSADNGGSIFANLKDTAGADHSLLSPAGLLVAGIFQHVALTYSKTSGLARIYRNGVLIAEQAVGLFMPQTSFPLYLGIRPSGSFAGYFYRGKLDELGIYNRALSGEEIQAIVNAGSVGRNCGPPEFVAQPLGQVVKPGSNVTFSVAARGSIPLSYQWRWEGMDLPNATNSLLTLTNARPSDAGAYSVRVTNTLGSLVSSNAVLKVNVITVTGNGQTLTNPVHSFGEPVTIQLHNFYAGGLVFYTLDGSMPWFLSEPYTGPFVVDQNAVVRAVGYSVDFFEAGESDPIQILIVPTYTLSPSTPGGGVIALEPASGSYLSNTVVTLAATPAAGWTFLQWLGDAAGSGALTTVTMSRNKSVQAVFGTTLQTTAAGGGSVAVNPPGGIYPFGTIVQLSAIPQPGRFFGIWGNATSGNINPLNFVVTNPNPTVSSLFAPVSGGQAALSVVPIGMGSVTVSPHANVYTIGGNVTITATPEVGQVFLGWSGDASGTQNPLPLTLNASKLIYADFSRQPRLDVRTPAERIRKDGVQLSIRGRIGDAYEVDSSTNLLDWTVLLAYTNGIGSMTITDSAATNASRRFYRAVVLP